MATGQRLMQWCVASTSTGDILFDANGLSITRTHGSRPFGFDGRKAYQFQAFEAIAFAAVKAASPDRIREVLGVMNYLAAPPVLYDATCPDMASIMGPLENQIHDLAIPDPTLGLYSASFPDHGAVIDKTVRDGVNHILFRRADIGTLGKLVSDWRAAGGEQMRDAYQQALQTAA
jgi:hypothetical protein